MDQTGPRPKIMEVKRLPVSPNSTLTAILCKQYNLYYRVCKIFKMLPGFQACSHIYLYLFTVHDFESITQVYTRTAEATNLTTVVQLGVIYLVCMQNFGNILHPSPFLRYCMLFAFPPPF